MLNLVLGRASSPGCPSFSETQLEKALHLVGVALHEEQRLRDRGVPPADSFFAFTAAATRSGLADALERWAPGGCPRVYSVLSRIPRETVGCHDAGHFFY